MAGRVAYYGGIVRDGLVLDLDAAKRDSYPGSGTTWRDIAGGVITGSLVGGPTFNPSSFGCLEFDGVDDYVNVGSSASSLLQGRTSFTIGLTFQIDTTAVLRGLIGTLAYGCGMNLGIVASYTNLIFYNDYGPANGSGTCFSTGFGNYIVTGSWIYAAATYDGTTTTMYAVKNGTLSQASTTAKSGSANVFSRNFEIMRGGSYYTDGRVANAFVYNRTLSSAEVLQNYNATKTRFGL